MHKILTDFHLHSNFSDGKHSIPEIVDYFGSRGFGAIAITDHLCESETLWGKAAAYLEHTLTPATFPLYLEILRTEAERAWGQYRMTLIPGVELTKNSFNNHRSAHVLALGISKFLPADGSIENILKNIREQGGISIAAHPVPTRKFEKQALHLWDRRDELAHLFDAWEVASGPYLFNEVLETGLPIIANSDLHRFAQMTSWKSILKCDNHKEAIFDAIRKQQVEFHFYENKNSSIGAPTEKELKYGHHRPLSVALDFCPFPHRAWDLDTSQSA